MISPYQTALVTAPGTHVLHPGDVICAERYERLETLLGSCIAIILTDPRRTIGAMCHIVHSRPATSKTAKPGAYADAAIDMLYALLRQRGFSPKLCNAFVYGGGNMFPVQCTQSHVGDDNSRRVLERLSNDGIKVVVNDIGGNAYRRLTWTIGPEMPQVMSVSVEEDQP